MRNQGPKYRSRIASAVVAAAGVAYFFGVRPWHLRWGATDEEYAGTLPGDDLCPAGINLATHAITIDAPPQNVWPWILQIGQDRGGFYSYAFLENLVGCEMHNTTHIVSEWQNRAVGDTVWFATPKHFGGQARMVAAIVEPEKSMVLVTPADWLRIESGNCGREETWGFVLRPEGERKTRLIVRARGPAHPPLWKRVADYAFLEPAHFIMERKMLLTIKRLAENQKTPA
jgi:hypothetical protein